MMTLLRKFQIKFWSKKAKFIKPFELDRFCRKNFPATKILVYMATCSENGYFSIQLEIYI